jgi:uncharacterized protein with PIN domain
MRYERVEMDKIAYCPYCKGEIILRDVKREVQGVGFLKQEIMYVCPHCDTIVGFSRGNYG